MASPDFQPVYETVETEGAVLKMWHQGNGPLLILIQGGGGTGEGFNAAFSGLSRHYNVATYDRRGNGQSTVVYPRTLNPMESARDVVAIIKALGYSSASLFGTSSGGIIALQVAQSYPEYVTRVVLHEVPLVSILPGESTKRVDSGYTVYEAYIANGAAAALRKFRASVSGKPEEQVDPEVLEREQDTPHRLDYFFRHEFLVFMIYTPNLDLVRASGVPIATVEGTESKGVFHAISGQIQSEILKCTHVIWPGGHAPFTENPEMFSEKLHKTLEALNCLPIR